MKYIFGLIILIVFMINISNGINIDPRIAYTVPYLAPDPSLKTSDNFYVSMGAQLTQGDNILPPIFGGLQPTITLNKNGNIHYSNVSSYDLTENIMKRANISNGDESWL